MPDEDPLMSGSGSASSGPLLDAQTAADMLDERARGTGPDAPEQAWEDLKRGGARGCESLDKIMALTGLPEVKRQALLTYNAITFEAQKKRMRGGAGVDTTTGTNMIFVGNPGTGKTTLAELIAALMKELGFRAGDYLRLTGSQCVQMGLDKFKEVLGKAKGGVLFLDEVYQMHPKKAGTVGQQMLDLLMDHLEVEP